MTRVDELDVSCQCFLEMAPHLFGVALVPGGQHVVKRLGVRHHLDLHRPRGHWFGQTHRSGPRQEVTRLFPRASSVSRGQGPGERPGAIVDRYVRPPTVEPRIRTVWLRTRRHDASLGSDLTASAAPVRAKEETNRLPYIALVAIVFAWGAGPIFAKLITAEPLVAVLVRFAMAFPVLFVIVHLRGRRVSVATLRRTAAPGFAYGINLVFIFEALQEATVAVVAVATALQPAVILIVAGPMFGERVTRMHAFWTLVGVCGATAVILGAGNELRASVLGVTLAFIAMGTFTVYFMLSRRARSTTDVDPMEWMAGVNLWAFLAVIPPVLLLVDFSEFGSVGGKDWIWLAGLAYCTGLIGHTLMSWVHGHLEASRSSLALLLMNIVSLGLAWPVFDEAVTLTQALGGVVVLVAVAKVLRIPTRPAS